MKNSRDPKQIVTPYAFVVDTSLLNKPLGTPARRLAAILADLALASLLTLMDGIVLAFIVAALFFVVAIRSRKGSRISFAAVVAGIVFLFSLIWVGEKSLKVGADINDTERSASASDIDWTTYIQKATSIDYTNADSAEAAVEHLGETLKQDILSGFGDRSKPPALPDNAADLLMAYARAFQKGDSTGMDTLHAPVQHIVAGQTITTLENENSGLLFFVEQLQEENDKLREAAENPGFLRMLKSIADDLGLAAGWTGVYFVLFLAFWKGQTPGKRLFKLKVVRLNGKPLSIWQAFGRFGGYAAGLATGLLGFAQVYWDANRQAIHDKIAGTVVLDVRNRSV